MGSGDSECREGEIEGQPPAVVMLLTSKSFELVFGSDIDGRND